MKSIVYTMSALAVTGAVFAMTGCASNEVLTKPAPSNDNYNGSSPHKFYDADPHKDRYNPTSEFFLANPEKEKNGFIENPNYISKPR